MNYMNRFVLLRDRMIANVPIFRRNLRVTSLFLFSFYTCHSTAQNKAIDDSLNAIHYFLSSVKTSSIALAKVNALQKVIDPKHEKYPVYLAYSAEANAYEGNFKEAINGYKKLLQISPSTRSSSLYFLSKYSKLNGELKEAIHYTRQIIKETPLSNHTEGDMDVQENARKELADLKYLDRKNKKPNKSDFDMSESGYASCLLISSAYFKKNKLDSALRHGLLYSGTQSITNNYSFFYLMAQIYLKKGEKEEAKGYYLEAIEAVNYKIKENEENKKGMAKKYFDCEFYRNESIEMNQILSDSLRFKNN